VRYVASVAPNLVASVTSVAGPNRGAALADALNGTLPDGSLSRTVVTTVVNGFASLIGLISGDDASQNSSAALNSLSTAGMAKFNAAHPEGLPTTSCGSGPELAANGVRYYSWSGTGVLTNALDVSDPALGLTSFFYSESNDGLVGRCSSHLGAVIRDNYFYNHLDEVNQVAGLTSIFESSPLTVFRAHANRLKNAGL
jgi:triacylglycerol lipase